MVESGLVPKKMFVDHIKLATHFMTALLLIDGNRFNSYKEIPHQCIIKGDGIYASIAAASVLAKTYRDEYMESLHEKFQMYHWNKNKGYGTREHRNAIEIYGLCRYHRKSFSIWPDFEDVEMNSIKNK
jgi:ribonuclease HII